MQYQRNRAWLEIDLDAISHNYRNIEANLVSPCRIIAVLKSNAYGLGSVGIAQRLEDLGCPMFAVVCIEEAMELRESGILSPILVMGPIDPEHVELAADNGIELALVSLDHAKLLSEAARSVGKRVRGHIKIDTGLNRLGILVKDRTETATEEIIRICAMEGIEPAALFTHFTTSEMPGCEEFNEGQLALFDEMSSRLQAAGLHLAKHCSSTIPALRYPERNHDYIRVAALLFGFEPYTYTGYDIKQVVQLKTRVLQIKEVKAGSPVSYGPLFHTLRDSKLAVVAIGFADGLRRSIQNRGFMLLHGMKSPIVGKLSSDYSIIDVTDIPEARENDIVTVFGRDGDIEQPVYDYADLYPGTTAEVTAVIGPRIPRFFITGGRESAKE